MKRILKKEKIDKKLAGQSTLQTTYEYMGRLLNNNKRTVSFDTHSMLDNKIDILTSMMNKLSTQDSSQNRPFKSKIYQGRKRGQCQNKYYDRDRQWDRFRLSSSDRYRR